jgi:hypothetical protein
VLKIRPKELSSSGNDPQWARLQEAYKSYLVWPLLPPSSRFVRGSESRAHKNTCALQFGSAGGGICHIRKFKEFQVNVMRGHSPWKKGRIFVYSAISTSIVAIGAVIQSLGGIDNVPPAVLWLLGATVGVSGVFLLIDTAYQSIVKKNVLCIHCGESRKIHSFCIARKCPHCGK